MKITEEAKAQIVKKLNNNYFRVGISGGGCVGYKYVFMLDNIKDKDILIDNIVIIDPKSFEYLQNSTLTFKSSLIENKFEVINDFVENTCGCGLSFELK